MAANSSVLSAELQVPLLLIPAILAAAAGGRFSPDHDDVTMHALRLNAARDFRLYCALQAAAIGSEPARTAAPPHSQLASAVAVLRVPLFVAAADGFQRICRFFWSPVWAQPVLAGAAGIRLDAMVFEAEPPVLLSVHAN